MAQCFYEILGISKKASVAEIKKAFHAQALKNHPDKGGDQEKFKEISEAYDVLSDQDKRQLYDQVGREGFKKSNGHGSGHGNGGGMDAFNIFKHMFGGGFEGGFFSQQAKQCPDIKKMVPLSLEEIYLGTTLQLDVECNVICPSCEGNGVKQHVIPEKCMICRGSGKRTFTRVLGPGFMQQTTTDCDKCHGLGTFVKEEDHCPECNSNKIIRKSKIFSLNIPPGAGNNQNIVIRGAGNQFPGHMSGNIILIIKEKPHDVFTRQDNDLHVKKTINLLEALSGFHFNLTLLNKEVLSIKCQSVIKDGELKRIINYGLPHLNNPGIKGSLIIKFTVIFPLQIIKTPDEMLSLEKHLGQERILSTELNDNVVNI